MTEHLLLSICEWPSSLLKPEALTSFLAPMS